MISAVITERNVAEFIRQVVWRAQRQLQASHAEHSNIVAELQRGLEAELAAMRMTLAEVRAHAVEKQAGHTDSNETIGQPYFKQKTVVGVCARESTDDVIYQLMSQLQDARNELSTTRKLLAEARAELSQCQALDAFNKWQKSATDTVN
jgi:hypothetical protein